MVYITLISFALIWLIFGVVTKNEEKSQHCITRSTIFLAAALLAILLD